MSFEKRDDETKEKESQPPVYRLYRIKLRRDFGRSSVLLVPTGDSGDSPLFFKQKSPGMMSLVNVGPTFLQLIVAHGLHDRGLSPDFRKDFVHGESSIEPMSSRAIAFMAAFFTICPLPARTYADGVSRFADLHPLRLRPRDLDVQDPLSLIRSIDHDAFLLMSPRNQPNNMVYVPSFFFFLPSFIFSYCYTANLLFAWICKRNMSQLSSLEGQPQLQLDNFGMPSFFGIPSCILDSVTDSWFGLYVFD